MFFDLFVPFPIAGSPFEITKKKKDKGKGKAVPIASSNEKPKSCWEGLTINEKERFAQSVALSGHREYTHPSS